MDGKMQIMIVNCIRTKRGGTWLHYIRSADMTDKFVGHQIEDTFFDNSNLFNNIKKEDLLKPLDVSYEYKENYAGRVSKIFKAIVTDDGRNLLV